MREFVGARNSPRGKGLFQMRCMEPDIASLQFLRRVTGISSGPDAAFGFMSSIASVISLTKKSSISSLKGCLILGGRNDAESREVLEGSLKTDKN